MDTLLRGCWAKIQRAEQSIGSLDNEIKAYFNNNQASYKIEGKHINDGTQYAFIATGNPNPPLHFSVLAGEIIHHLRSSLDHLIHALILKNGGTPSNKNQFPICTTVEAFEDQCKRGRISGASESAEVLVRSVQPYTSHTPNDTVLYAINDYNNQDKHRLLVVTTTIGQIGKNITIGADAEIAKRQDRLGKTPNIVGFGDPSPKQICKDGTIIFTINLAEAAPELTAEAEFVPELAFEQCGQVTNAPVTKVLSGLLAGTRHTLELFTKEFI